jgi:copper chaperone
MIRHNQFSWKGSYMSQATFNVPSISCGHCVRAIRAALGEVVGIQQVNVEIGTKQVEVIYDSTLVNETQMETVLAEADYPVAKVDAEQQEELLLTATSVSCSCCHI